MNHKDLKKVIIKIKEDKHKRRYGEVYYDFGNETGPISAFELKDTYTKGWVKYFTSKGLVSDEPGKYLFVDLINGKTIKNLRYKDEFNFGIAASQPDDRSLSLLITFCECAASNLDLLIPLYITNGLEEVFYNKSYLDSKLNKQPYDVLYSDNAIQKTIKMIRSKNSDI